MEKVKEIDRSKQRRWGIVLTYIQMFLSILVNIVCTPIILNKLGQSEFGLYNVTASIISYLSLLTLGFGASYIRFYSRYKAQNDEDGIAKLNGLYMVVFLIMGAVALALGLVLSFNSSILFNSTYSASDLHTAKILLLLLTFNMAISFPMSVYSAIITSQEEFIFQKIINIGKTVLSPAISIVAIFLGYGSIGMVVTITALSLVIDAINIFYCKVKIKARFKFGKLDKFLLKEILIFSFFIAINQLIDQLNAQTDKIILGKAINAAAVAVYTIASTIYTMYVNFSVAVHSVFAPKIHKIVNSGDSDTDNQLTELFIKIGRIQFFILMLILSGFVFFGKYFIGIWAGPDYDIAYYLILILMVPSTVPLIQNIGIEIQRAKNKHQFRSLVYLLVAVINVAISIILVKFYGIVGVTIGTAFANIVGCCIIMNIYYHKKIGLNIIKFWKSILRASLGLILPAACGTLLMLFIKFNNFWIYLLYIAGYTLIYLISIYIFGMNKEEKEFVKNVIKKVKWAIKQLMLVPIKFLKKMKISYNYDILIYSHFDTMDPHVLAFYNAIKDEKYKVKLVFFKYNKIDKQKYLKYNLNKKDVILSKIKYLMSNPKIFVVADLSPNYEKAFASKYIYVNHGSNTLAWGTRDIPYAYQYCKKYFDVYFETNKLVVEKFCANKNLIGKLVYSGNKFSDSYKTEEKNRDQLRKKYDIKKNQRVIFFTSSWNRNSLFQVLGKSGLEYIKTLANNLKYKIIVSVHPREYTKYDPNIEPIGPEIDNLEQYGVIVRKPTEDFIPFLIMSDLVVTDFTSMGDHAIMLGKDICYSNFDYCNIYEYACSQQLKGKVPVFSNFEELQEIINSIYPQESRNAINEVRKQMDTEIGFWDELCKETIKHLLRKNDE